MVDSDSEKYVAQARAAFERLAEEIAGVPAELVQRVNLDVAAVTGTVIARLPGLQALRPEIEKHLPTFDLARFDKLEDYAHALFYAHGAYLVATEPPRSIEDLAARATKVRKVLLGDALALAAREIFPEARIEEIQKGAGYRDLGEDLIALVHLYRGNWARVADATGIKEPELEHAEALASQIVVQMALREQAPLVRSAAIDQRERAFALLIDAYNDARRAVLYLRHKDGDANAIAPSLYAGRSRAKPSEAELVPPPESGSIPVPGANAPVSTGAAIGAGEPFIKPA